MTDDIFKEILDYIKAERASLEYEIDNAMDMSEKSRYGLLGKIMLLNDFEWYIKDLMMKKRA